MADTITIRGAREHNLRNVDLELPRDKLIVFTGLSGSGKSSLAFDTIYAEGQRRYVESLSAYARQFLGQMDKPDVDFIEGLSPAISIDQKSGVEEPAFDGRHHHRDLRLPAAALRPHRRPALPRTAGGSSPARRRSRSSTVCSNSPKAPGSRCSRRSSGAARASTRGCSRSWRTQGFTRARVDGEVVDLGGGEPSAWPATRTTRSRWSSTASCGAPASSVASPTRWRPRCASPRASPRSRSCPARATDERVETLTFSEHLACTHCGVSFDELAPRNFSFNSPYGACERCDGLGTRFEVDPELVVPNDDLSISEGAIAPWSGFRSHYFERVLESVAAEYGFSVDTPWKKLKKNDRRRSCSTAPAARR